MHFSLAVITKEKPTEEYIDDVMSPYQDNNYGTCDPEHLEFCPIGSDEFEDFLKDFNESNSEMKFGEFMNKMGFEFDEGSGQYGYYCNPNARWDYHTIGGRWAGSLAVKKGCEYIRGEMPMLSDGTSAYESKDSEIIKCDGAKIKDLIFPDEENEMKRAKRIWELIVEGEPLRCDSDYVITADAYWTKERLLKRYSDKKSFIKNQSGIWTYAAINKEGEWIDVEDAETFESLLKKADKNDYITIVDCHM